MSVSTWNGATGDWGDATQWTGPVPNGATADATISSTASYYTTTIAAGETFTARNVTLNSAKATLDIEGTLKLAKTLNFTAGSLILNGTLSGGTVMAADGVYLNTYGGVRPQTLDHVKWVGTLALAESARIVVTNGLTVLAQDGTSPGTISTKQIDDDTAIAFVGTQSLDNVSLVRGRYTLTISGGSDVLTLGAHFTASTAEIVFNVPDVYNLSGNPSGSIVNLGSIVTSRLFLQKSVALTNRGSITTPSLKAVLGSTFFNDTSGTIKLSLDYQRNSTANFEDMFTNAGLLDADLSIAAQPGYIETNVMRVAGLFTNAATGTLKIANYVVTASGDFTNRGTVTVGRLGSLGVAGTFKNYGSVSVTNGGSITLGTNVYAYSGSTLTITNSTFIFSSYVSDAFINRYRGLGNTVGYATSINNTGATLTFSAGTIKGELDQGGTITGGTIVNSDGASFVVNAGTLDGVTIKGPAIFTPVFGTSNYTTIRDGLTVLALDGTAPGAVTLGYGGLYFEGTQTFDNADVASTRGLIFARTGTLTLGSHLTIRPGEAGASVSLLVGYQGALVNSGTISGPFYVTGTGTFTNNGTMIAAGGISNIDLATFTNLSGTTLTGGSYEADANSSFGIVATGKIVTDNADITLSGTGSVFGTETATYNRLVSIEETLQTVGAMGQLHLVDGRDWTGIKPIVDDGLITLDGGTFTAGAVISGSPGAGTVTVDASGTFSGHGDLGVRKLTNNGAVDAAGGVLDVVGTVSGSGTFHVGDGATLEFGSSVAAGSVVDLLGPGAALSLDSPLKFHGAIADFGAGDEITLKDTTANSFVYVPTSNKLFVRENTTTVAVLQLQGAYQAGSFHLTQNGADAGITYGTAQA